MNRYEIAASHSTQDGHQDWGAYTIHASSPRVALQRVMLQIRPLDVPVTAGRGISLRFDVVNRGKVRAFVEVRWEDCREYSVNNFDGQLRAGGRYSVHDDDGKCQVERKSYGYLTEYIMAGEPIPEGWEVYKQNEPYQYRFKPGADLAMLSAGYLANKEG